MRKLISKLVLCFLSIIIAFQAHQVFADEELPIITIDFVTGDIIDLDKNPQMIRADIEIQYYNPQDGYHYMEITRLSDGEIIKNTEILPKVIGGTEEDNVFGVQVLHYLDPDEDAETLIGDYGFRIYSEFGTSEALSTFSIIKPSMPIIVTQNEVEEIVTPEDYSETVEGSEELVTPEEESQPENLVNSESKIPSWVHDIFVWYANGTISENELLAALEYLISEGTIDVDTN